METGQRGFIITGEESFLEPFDRANEKFDNLLAELRIHFTGKPECLDALEKMEHLRYKWLGAAGMPEIQLRRQINESNISLKTIERLIAEGTGKQVLDNIRTATDAMSTQFRAADKKDELVLLTQISKDVVDSETGQRGFLLSGKDSFLEPYYSGQINFDKHVRQLETMIGGDEANLDRLTNIKNLYQQWLVKAARPEIYARVEYQKNPHSMDDVAVLLKKETGKKIIDQLRDLIGEFTNNLSKDVDEELFRSERNAALAGIISFMTGGIGMLLSVIFAFLIGRSIVKPVGILMNGTQKIAEGDLTHKIELSNKDELGSLAESFNRMTNKLRVSKEVLDSANKQLKASARQAEAANTAKSQFLANMSHEIRTPMNGIIGFGDLLAEENLTDDQAGYVKLIRNSGHSLLNLINDILDFSKIEAGKLDIEIVECSLSKLLNSIESLMRPKAVEKGLEFAVTETTVLPETIKTDPMRLQQCLINLLSNAIKFTETGHIHANISLDEFEGEPFIRLDIEDTGIGIPEDKQETIFESFSQADGSTSRKYGGTGLGLAITKQLAQLLGGNLTLTSQEGKGSTFSLIIAANVDVTKQPLLDRNSIAGHTHPKWAKEEQHEFSGCVLVAEDVKTNQVLIKTLLKRMGLEVTIAKDGNEAVEKALANKFDLILMDIMMPYMNGYEATKALRKQDITTPIIALTANAMKGDEQKCINAGCDDYLSKPVDRTELLEKLQKYLQAEIKV